MRIKAAVVYERSGRFTVDEIELSDPKDDEVLVRIAATGICHTDLAGREQYLPIPPERAFPHVFGHEGAGVVEKVGARVTKVKPGDHVALSWDSCGACPSCKSGNEPYCDNLFLYNFNGARPDGTATLRKGGKVIHGSFFCQSSLADFALAGERNVVKVRDDVPVEILGPLGCGIRTGAGAVMNTLRPPPGSSIAIFGAGPVGMSALLAAVVCGCTTIIAVDVIPERLEKAKEFGATHTVHAGMSDPVRAVLEITGGGAQYSLECVGNPNVLRQAVDVLPRLGVCGLLGVVPPGTEVALNMDLIMNGRTVRGVLAGDSVSDLFIPRLLDLYKQGRFPFDKLITFYPFDEINRAVEDMEKGRVIKPVLRMNG
ncbi:MAG: NAD(P)-dependent alcohol dehydrogenase [Desulfobacteraceae bacterium]|nr:MAG: NAD(P)-dependent alcohol dehydrogenase [Desulfobacteraceae bacterium]